MVIVFRGADTVNVRSNSFIIFLIVLLLSVLVLGCAKQDSDNDSVQILTANAKYDFIIGITPSPAKILKENKMVITIRDKTGKVIDDANVKVLLSMEEMDHGDLSVSVNKEEGEYVARVIPVMQGTWIADVTAAIGEEQVTVKYTFSAVY